MFTIWTQNTEGLLIKFAAAAVAELMLCAVAARLTMLSRPDCWMRSRKMTFSQQSVRSFVFPKNPLCKYQIREGELTGE